MPEPQKRAPAKKQPAARKQAASRSRATSRSQAPLAGRASTGRGSGVQAELKKRAIAALKDPKVQALIIERASAVVGAAQQWIADRPARTKPSLVEQVKEKVGDRFGQKGLERRSANVRSAVTKLCSDSADLRDSLQPVEESLDEIDKLLVVAANLPFTKRKKAHRRIDDALDDLEAGLFDTVLGPETQT